MAAKREILCVGLDAGTQKWKRVEWLDPAGLHDFNLVFLDPDGLTDGKAGTDDLSERDGVAIINQNSPASLAMDRRAVEFVTLIESGGDIVVFAEPARVVQNERGGVYTGWDLLPSTPVLTTSEGSKILVQDSGPLGRFIEKYEQRVQYKVTLDLPKWDGWLSLASTMTGLPVAAYRQLQDQGRIVVLPWIDRKFTKMRSAKELANSVEDILKSGKLREPDSLAEAEFWTDLVNALSATEIERKAPPIWASAYATAAEVAAAFDLEKQEAVVKKESDKLELAKAALDEERLLKPLLYGTDTELEESVRFAFEKLGATSLPVEPDRADLLLQFDDWRAIVEIKGQTKSASESNAAQLEKWAADATDAKPILLVNAFRGTTPVERTKDAFPHQMLKYSTAREHALMTATQLYVAVDKVQRGETTPEAFLTLLRSTVGLLPGFEIGELPKHE